MRRATLIALAAAAAAAVAAGCGGGEDDDRAAQAPEPVPLGEQVYPDEVAAAPDGSLWLLAGQDVGRIAPGGDRFAASPQRLVPEGELMTIHDLAAGDAGVWAITSGGEDGTFLISVDPGSGRVRRPVRSRVYSAYLQGGESLHVASGASHVWSAREGGDEVLMLDPATGKERRLTTGAEVESVAAGGGHGWAITRASEDPTAGGALVRFDPASPRRTQTFDLEDEPTAVAFGAGSVWLLYDRRVERRAVDGKLQAEVDLSAGDFDGAVGNIAVGGDTVWATSFGEGQLVRIDTETNRVDGKPFAIADPTELAATPDAAWITRNYEDVLRSRR